MSRTLTAAFAAAIAEDVVRLAHLTKFEMDSGDALLTDFYKPIVYDSETYTAFGHHLGFDAVEESAKLIVNDTQVILSNVDQLYLSLFLNENYINRKATIWLAALGEDDALIADPLKLIEGRLDDPVSNEDPDSGTSTLSVRIINQWSDYERISGRVANDANQQLLFPGDDGLKYAHQVLSPITWGRKT